jgi:hypothetical protein
MEMQMKLAAVNHGDTIDGAEMESEKAKLEVQQEQEKLKQQQQKTQGNQPKPQGDGNTLSQAPGGPPS